MQQKVAWKKPARRKENQERIKSQKPKQEFPGKGMFTISETSEIRIEKGPLDSAVQSSLWPSEADGQTQAAVWFQWPMQ